MHAAKGTTGLITELGKVVRTEVGQLVMFAVTPDVLHRIEFRAYAGNHSISRRPRWAAMNSLTSRARCAGSPSHTTSSLPWRWRSRWRRKSITWGARIVPG